MKLADLNPATVGRAATDAVLARLARLAMPLSPGVTLHVGQPQGDTDLGLTVASLCAWAQSGALGDWADHKDAADALLGATEVLYRAPLGDARSAASSAAAKIGRADSDPVALVLAAAWSRVRICRGESVTLRELARLASLAPSRVKQFSSAKRLPASGRGGPQPHRVEAAEARRWLASRGLAGW